MEMCGVTGIRTDGGNAVVLTLQESTPLAGGGGPRLKTRHTNSVHDTPRRYNINMH